MTEVLPVHKAQALSHMKLLDLPLGLVISFNVPLFKQGIHRVMLPGASAEELKRK